MPELGQFNFLGAYQTNTPTTTATGGRVDSFATTLSAWGKLRRNSGSKSSNTEIEIQSAWTWECHFTAAITPSELNRWLIEGRTFTINDFELIDQKRQFYRFKLLAVE